MIIGFSNGDFHRLYQDELERFSKDYIDIFSANNLANALELNCLNESHLDHILNSSETTLSNFKYISLHAPDMAYQKDESSQRVLSKLASAVKKYNIKNIVFHTDKVKD